MKSIKLAMLFLIACGGTVARAEVVDGQFHSKALGVEKSYRVYLPASYSLEDRSYPVIYLLHGWGVTERAWTDILKVHETADRLELQALIVMPDGDRSLYANAVAAVDYEACLIETNPKANPNEARDFICSTLSKRQVNINRAWASLPLLPRNSGYGLRHQESGQ